MPDQYKVLSRIDHGEKDGSLTIYAPDKPHQRHLEPIVMRDGKVKLVTYGGPFIPRSKIRDEKVLDWVARGVIEATNDDEGEKRYDKKKEQEEPSIVSAHPMTRERVTRKKIT